MSGFYMDDVLFKMEVDAIKEVKSELEKQNNYMNSRINDFDLGVNKFKKLKVYKAGFDRFYDINTLYIEHLIEFIEALNGIYNNFKYVDEQIARKY